jgi:hypothetical protein
MGVVLQKLSLSKKSSVLSADREVFDFGNVLMAERKCKLVITCALLQHGYIVSTLSRVAGCSDYRTCGCHVGQKSCGVMAQFGQVGLLLSVQKN